MANKTRAEQKRSAKPSFYEVAFRGKPKVVRAFLHGLTMGAGEEATIFINYTDGIRHEGKIERMAEKVGLVASDCRVVVDAGTSALLKSLAKRIVAETGLEMTAHRRVKSASMGFTFRVYTPQLNAELVKAVKNLPAGVKVQGYKHEVKSDPSARGVEAYAPSHHYEAHGEGVLQGPVDALVGIRHRLDKYPMIAAEEIQLVLA